MLTGIANAAHPQQPLSLTSCSSSTVSWPLLDQLPSPSPTPHPHPPTAQASNPEVEEPPLILMLPLGHATCHCCRSLPGLQAAHLSPVPLPGPGQQPLTGLPLSLPPAPPRSQGANLFLFIGLPKASPRGPTLCFWPLSTSPGTPRAPAHGCLPAPTGFLAPRPLHLLQSFSGGPSR